MKTHLVTLSLVIVLSALLGACKKSTPGQSGTASGASQAVLLKAKWPVGNRYVYRMDLDQRSTNKVPQLPKPIEQDVTMAMTYALSVLKETPDGGRDLEMEFLANEMEVRMGDQVILSFDSKESGGNEAQNPMLTPFRKMIGSKVHLLVNADAKVTSVEGLEEWHQNLGLDQAGPGGQMLTRQFNEGFFRQMTDFGRSLSAKPVRIGETWPFKMDVPVGGMGKIAVDSKITFKGWEQHDQHHSAVLDTRATLKGTPGQEVGPMGKMSLDRGKVVATSWFDPELGALLESISDQSMRVSGQMPGGPGGNQAGLAFTSELGQKVTVKLVELKRPNS